MDSVKQGTLGPGAGCGLTGMEGKRGLDRQTIHHTERRRRAPGRGNPGLLTPASGTFLGL